MVKPSKIETNANYHFFKKGIKPMWEDPHNSKVQAHYYYTAHNCQGGKWVITLKDKALVDILWENVVSIYICDQLAWLNQILQLLSLVGETMDVADELCGAVFSRRKGGDRVAVWNRSRDNETAIMTVGYGGSFSLPSTDFFLAAS